MTTILQIDDLEAMHHLVRALLANRSDTRLISTASGMEGLALAKSEKPNLILLDVDMPEMRGPDVLARLKSDPSTADIPVVVVSGSAEMEVIDAMLANGALHHLAKPFTELALFAVVDSFQGPT